MKILVIADVESKSLWDYFHPKKLEGIELIISCGDLNPKYLSFLATFFMGMCYMFMEIMMKFMRVIHRLDVFV